MHTLEPLDSRYTIEKEYCGYEYSKWVLRFCDEWIDCFSCYADAKIAAFQHNRERLEKL